ncbi:hypothetical protein ACEWY4_012297 [Coilia grayii]|uniref:Phospholipid/glycerol acyltransferase domain-containing protein n=1 Tax=Coilia grayii TaxID=363190 RepID=A0ABD1K038_9TELE
MGKGLGKQAEDERARETKKHLLQNICGTKKTIKKRAMAVTEAEIGAGDAPSKPALSWGMKIRKKLKTVSPFLGRTRPMVGQCCHKCAPESLGRKLLQNTPSLGFQNLLSINETHTRYRGWLVRRVCCMLFVGGCRVYSGRTHDRLHRVCCSDRAWSLVSCTARSPDESFLKHLDVSARARANQILSLASTSISPALLRVQVNLNQLAALRRAAQLKLNIISNSKQDYICNITLSGGPTLHPNPSISTTAAAPRPSLPLLLSSSPLPGGGVEASAGLSDSPSAERERDNELLYGTRSHERPAGCALSTPLVFVSVRQSFVDQVLIALVLFCHSLRVPYTISPENVNNPLLRAVLRRLGVILLPCGAISEEDAETDSLYSPLMSALTCALLQDGESLSLALAADSGLGGQWLARLQQAVADGNAADVNLVPVAISYDQPPDPHALQQEMVTTSRCRMNRGRPLEELLLPVILNHRLEVGYGEKDTSWMLPPTFMPELQPEDRQLTVALTLHLIYSTSSCMAVMATQLISCLLLHKHRKGVRVTGLCREVCWLLEEVLFRRRDVGFAGSVVEVVYLALSLLAPHLIMAAPPPTAEPLLAPGKRPAARHALARHAHTLTHTFITEAVGACAVSAMLREVACCGDVGEMEFDVALCQEELTDRALQLTLLLPAGYIPPCLSAQSFALDAVDSLVRCGILVMEELPRDTPMCDIMKRQGALTWNAADESDNSDSDCEDQEARSFKLSHPAQCPDMLFFLCSLLSVQLRALCWAIQGLDLLHTPLPVSDCVAQLHACVQNQANVDREHHESSSMDLVKISVRTLIDLGVLTEEREDCCVYLHLSPVFQLKDNREKVHKFVSQFLYN